MKRVLISVVAVLFLSTGWTRVPAALTPATREEEIILTIRRRYAAVNSNLPKYRLVKKRLSGFSTEGGELVAYFDGASIMKLKASYYGETGRSLEEFYYWDGKLFFVYHKGSMYDAPMSGRVSSTAEERFYFHDDALIRWINSEARRVAPGSAEYTGAQAYYLDSSKQLLEAARSQNPTIEAAAPRQ